MHRTLDTVILIAGLPAEHLKRGDVGTVVHLHKGGAGYEVEFVALDGQTIGVVTLTPAQIRPAGPREIPNARALA
jgi:hypothetical protein